MAIVQKALRLTYQSKFNTTGLTDVKGQVYLNGAAKAVGANALVFSEVDATNEPGFYELLIPAATLSTWGVTAGSYNAITGSADSVSKPAKAGFKAELTVANTDDVIALLGTPVNATLALDIAAISTKLGTPAGASVSVDIAAVKADTAAIKYDLENGSSSLATILSNIQALQNASIGNGVGYVIPTMIVPASGSNSYMIPITIQNDAGALVDPTGALITVGAKNSAGVDRGNYLVGNNGASPATVSATRSSVAPAGEFYVMVSIPAGAIEEELVFSFAYSLGSNSMVRFGVSQLLADAAAQGYALQTTLLATQTTVNTINAAIGSATYGLAALQAMLANGTYGLASLQSLLSNGTYGLSALQSILANGTYGLSALAGILNNPTYGLSALLAQSQALGGTGFVAGTDDLHSLSTFMRNNLYYGGKAQ